MDRDYGILSKMGEESGLDMKHGVWSLQGSEDSDLGSS